MSRYHDVRPKKQQTGQKPQVANPRQEQVDALARIADQLYAERNGGAIDAAIARCERTLALYDREIAKLGESEKEGHRWCISPTVALRWQNELTKLQDRKEKLQQECWTFATEIVQDAMRQKAMGSDSLCPPKSAEAANEAGSWAAAGMEEGELHNTGPQGGGPATPTRA